MATSKGWVIDLTVSSFLTQHSRIFLSMTTSKRALRTSVCHVSCRSWDLPPRLEPGRFVLWHQNRWRSVWLTKNHFPTSQRQRTCELSLWLSLKWVYLLWHTSESAMYLTIKRLQIYSGRMPFPHIREDPGVILAVMNGDRPKRSRYPQISQHIWNMLEKCWNVDPSQQPSMATLSLFFASLF